MTSVIQVNATNVEVSVPASTVVEVSAKTPVQNLFVQDVHPTFSGPGMWIQTGMGTGGTDFTIWFEDGK